MIPGIGEESFNRRLKNACIVGYCGECGGEVKKIIKGRCGRMYICTKCGMVNPRFRRSELKDEDVVKAMRTAFEEISNRTGEEVLDGQAWLAVVQYLLGQSIPMSVWKKRAERWIEEAGLAVEDGMVKKR